MKVRNRDGEECQISFDEIKNRICTLCTNEELRVLDIDKIVIQTINGIFDGITTSQLDELSASICANMQSVHYLYDSLAGKIIASNMHKNIKRIIAIDDVTFSSKVEYIENKVSGSFNKPFLDYVRANCKVLDSYVDYSRDYIHNYFSVKTLQKAYLMSVHGQFIETAQDMWMRVAVAINCESAKGDEGLKTIRLCYDQMSTGFFTHASPTLFNAGTCFEQLSSCYLLGTDDSISGIFKTISDCATISKWGGGIGVHVSNVRAKGSRIKSTNGRSDGIIPMLKVYNETGRYCNQSGKRKGSIAIYLEPWHADVWEFLELRQNTGAETERARDIFLALWVPDEFMRRVKEGLDWYLMSPDDCPGLCDVYGEEFEQLYARYVEEKRYVKVIDARVLWQHVLKNLMETGTPYILFKDHVNRRTNHANLGTIKSSNLCAEICEYSDEKSYAVCNLASIAVNKFLMPDGNYDHAHLHAIAKLVTKNLNKIIDRNMYPTPETRQSNLQTRPIGIGIQGIGDLLCSLKIPYEDPAAMEMEAEIMETIYHGALEASIELAETDGAYESFDGSPFSEGVLQFDMGYGSVHHSGMWNWETLKQRLKTSGARNSLVTALMPTASTSQILCNCEAFEPFHANVFKRTTIAGEFMVINKYLMIDLIKLGLWNDEMREMILRCDGSVQDIAVIPTELKTVYKTVWEVTQRSIIDHAAMRAPYVDQSQSMNLFQAQPNLTKLSSALMHAWTSGVKTGCYYLRSRPANEAIKVGLIGGSGGVLANTGDNADAVAACSRANPEGCVMCSG